MKIEVYSPTIRRKEMDAVLTALVEDKVGPGEHAQNLVRIAKERLQFDYCLALRSPATALSLALRSFNLEHGQGVVVSALSPRYYKQVIEGLGLVPVYADVASSSASVSPETVEAARSRQDGPPVRCMILDHTLGYVPDMAGLLDLGLPAIDDRSRSYGSLAAERPLGATAAAAETPPPETPYRSGALSILGLEEKDLLTAGGGALLYAMNRRDAGALRSYADLPREYGLPDMNAAMAVVQFREAARNLEKRKEIARVYAQAGLRTRHKRFVQSDAYEYNNYAFALILETGIKDVMAYAKKKDIAVENALEDTLMGAGVVAAGLCPEAYSLSLRTALFPLYPRLSGPEIEKVSKLIMTLP
ncbi:MAG: DegT/DnrJ/EryC1/StrS family aminotransferase [Treponema sp.]|jgi:dTDP-4-amino-4,6-dideoxygalactose transaminase|nr:DegT/DnrJ/EryC1/StrS family aminotransferase [Treponema sp.]